MGTQHTQFLWEMDNNGNMEISFKSDCIYRQRPTTNCLPLNTFERTCELRQLNLADNCTIRSQVDQDQFSCCVKFLADI